MARRFAVLAGVVLFFAVLVVALAPPASAADFRSGETITITKDQVIDDDLFVTARDVVIDGTVNGDVYALAQNLTINGTVTHDVNAAAQTIEINGKVGDTARLGGQAIIFGESADVARTTMLGGFSLETRPGSALNGDLLFGAYQALLGGNVSRDVIAGGNGIELTGNVGRNMRVTIADSRSGFQPSMFMRGSTVSVPNVAPGLTIASTAKIGGDLVYESQKPANVASSSQVTGPVVQQTPVPTAREQPQPTTPEQIQAQQTDAVQQTLWNGARRFIILLLIGLLALWLLPKWIGSLASFAQKNPLGSLGRGALMVMGVIVGLVALVIVVLLLALFFGILTLGALSAAIVVSGTVLLSAIAVGFWLFTAYIAPIVVSYLIGRLLLSRIQAGWAQNRFLAFFIGLILLSLLALVPFLNILVGLLVSLLALGALVLWWSNRKPTAELVAAPSV